jgi:hypothetical protein
MFRVIEIISVSIEVDIKFLCYLNTKQASEV